ncbi:unnamed protein product [Thlaspi arvense]|uniref:Uncharacterized protein n=1 Tax=Thlaspi arvense TaxID=13288 RepID=A0AAU9S656_THLAR|nr:unnamed protein product [Thlaspi arvense]
MSFYIQSRSSYSRSLNRDIANQATEIERRARALRVLDIISTKSCVASNRQDHLGIVQEFLQTDSRRFRDQSISEDFDLSRTRNGISSVLEEVMLEDSSSMQQRNGWSFDAYGLLSARLHGKRSTRARKKRSLPNATNGFQVLSSYLKRSHLYVAWPLCHSSIVVRTRFSHGIESKKSVLLFNKLSSLYIPFSTTTKTTTKRKSRTREREREMDLDWEAFFRDYEWFIEYLKGMVKPAAALAVVLLAVALSYSQKLSLEGEMIYSVFRSFVQLSVIGFVLQFIFNQENAGWIILAYLFMVVVAGYTAGERAKHVPRGKYVAGVSILVGTAITMFLLIILNVFPFTPRYMIPVAGMVVGNAMTVTGVTMKQLRADIKMQLNLVETALALGATPRQATLQQVKRALVISLSPVLDSCKTVGLISLPGAMTGMIMGGASPLEAIQLQIVVMNMLVGAATVSSIMSTYLCWPSFFTKAYQLQTHVFSSD